MMNTVTVAALIKRINRKLAHDDKRLCRARPLEAQNVGDFYILDVSRNFVVDGHVDPVVLGREVGVLHELETVTADDE